LGEQTPSIIAPTEPQWEVDPTEIQFKQKIGEGHFGEVYKAKWRGAPCVGKIPFFFPSSPKSDILKSLLLFSWVSNLRTVKKLKLTTSASIEQFLQEAKMMRYSSLFLLLNKKKRELTLFLCVFPPFFSFLFFSSRELGNHPNVVTLLGVCTNPENPMILTEFVDAGSLFNLIRDQTFQYGAKFVMSIAKQIAGGMIQLHKRNLLHCDLATRNILVSQRGNKIVAKVTLIGMRLQCFCFCFFFFFSDCLLFSSFSSF
jgi:serine/threonine protein kinase